MSRDSALVEERTVHEIARTLDNLKATIFAGLATPDGRLIYANRQALEVVGAQLDQVQGKPAPDTPWLANSSEAQANMHAALRSAAEGVPAGFEFPYRRRDGRMSTMDLGVKPVMDAQSQVEYLVISAQDVSERKQIEQLLWLTNTSMDQAALGQIQINAHGMVHSANDALCTLLGHSRETLRGLPVSRLSQRVAEEGWPRIWDKFKTRSTAKYEATYLHADGHPIPVEVVATHMRHNDEDFLFAVVTDLTERKQAEKHIHFLAHYDPLTGLPNRKHFAKVVERYLHGAEREQSKAALMIADIEHFYALNESYGREIGDLVLTEVAERLLHYAQGQNRFARIGADQFAIVLGGVKTIDEVEKRVRRKLKECFKAPFKIGGHEIHLGARFGVAMFPDAGLDAETLFRRAETALIRAKEGGEKYAFFAKGMEGSAAERMRLESRLRGALERNEFVLHYQPKYGVTSGAIEGLEALLRWNDAERGLTGPAEFVPLLESTGMIVEVGAWVIQQVIGDIQAWRSQGLATPRVAVNVSAVQLRKHDFVQNLKQELKAAGPSMIDLEITESLVMEDIEENIRKLAGVKAMGVEIAVDDFGTGYSSLAYLTRLPVQVLKIDRSFTSGMLREPDKKTMVAAIISLAHALRLKVVAEGVETAAQAQVLHEMGCDQLQGFHFGRPIDAASLATLLPKAS